MKSKMMKKRDIIERIHARREVGFNQFYEDALCDVLGFVPRRRRAR